jgi:hypothetical protein
VHSSGQSNGALGKSKKSRRKIRSTELWLLVVIYWPNI